MALDTEPARQTGESEYTISNDDWDMWSQVLREAALKIPGSKPMTRESLQQEMNGKLRVSVYGHRALELIEGHRNVFTFVQDATHKKLIILSWRIKIISHDRKKAGTFIATKTTIKYYEESSSPDRSMWMRVRNIPDARFAADQITPDVLACVPEDGLLLSPFEHALLVQKRDAEIENLCERLVRSELKVDKKTAMLVAAEHRAQRLERAARARAQRTKMIRVIRKKKDQKKALDPVENARDASQVHLIQEVVGAMKQIWEVKTWDRRGMKEVDGHEKTNDVDTFDERKDDEVPDLVSNGSKVDGPDNDNTEMLIRRVMTNNEGTTLGTHGTKVSVNQYGGANADGDEGLDYGTNDSVPAKGDTDLAEIVKERGVTAAERAADDMEAPESVIEETSDALFDKLLQVIKEHKTMPTQHYEGLGQKGDGDKKRKCHFGSSDEMSEKPSDPCNSLSPFKKRRCSASL